MSRLGSGFLRHVVLLAGGTALSQAILIATSPIIARLYTPGEFGQFSVFTAVMLVVTAIVSWRYEMAIPLPRSRETASAVFWLSIVICSGTSLVAAAITAALVLGDIVPQSLEPARHELWMIPIGVFGAGLFQTLRSFAGREQQFAAVGTASIAQSVARTAGQVAGGLAGAGATGLAAGYAASQFFGVAGMARRLRPLLGRPRVSALLAAGREYRAFPLFNQWAALITVLGLNVPSIMLAGSFSADVAGHFSMSMRILGLPAILVGQAVAQVFYPKAAQMAHSDEASSNLVERLAAGLLFLSVPTFALLMLHGAFAFSFVFGSQWATAGLYSSYLAPFFLVSFIATPLCSVALIKNRQGTAFLITVAEAGLRLFAIAAGARLQSATWAVGLFSVAGALICVNYIAWVFRLASVRPAAFAWRIRGYVATAVLAASACAVLKYLVHPEIVAVIASCAIFGAHLLWAWRTYRADFGLPSPRPAGTPGIGAPPA